MAMLVIEKQMQMINIEERRIVVEPIEVLEDVRDVHLDESNPEGFARIKTSMEEKTK